MAFYNRGNQFPKLITINIDGSISSVMLPTFSKEQNDKEKLKNIMRRAIKTSSFILFPMLFGLAAISEPIVKIILTDKWLPSVPIMQLLCFSYALWPIHTINLQAINAVGRSDVFLKLEIIKKLIGITLLAISIPFGMYFMVVTKIISSLIATFVNSYPNKKLLNYSFKEQWKDIMPSIVVASIMAIIVYGINFLNINVILKLFIQIIIGVNIYIVISYIFKIESFEYIYNNIKNFFKKRGIKNDTISNI